MGELDQLRREIDRIDDALLDLLVRRIAIGKAVARSKTGTAGLSRRPGREAQILHRLRGQLQPPLLADSMVRIWREILSANLSQQTTVTAAMHVPDLPGRMAAHDYCGSSVVLTTCDSARCVLQEVSDKRAQIGILPGFSTDDPDRWWPELLAQPYSDRPRIIAALPLVRDAGSAPQALVVADQDPEESGCDHSIVAVRHASRYPAGRMLDNWPGDGGWELFEVDGFGPASDPSDDPERHCLGAYSCPLSP